MLTRLLDDFDEPDDLDEPPDLEELPDLELLPDLEPLDLLLPPDFEAPDLLLEPPLPDLEPLDLELLDFEAPALLPPDNLLELPVDLLLELFAAVDLPDVPDFAEDNDFEDDDFDAPLFAAEPDLVAAVDLELELLPLDEDFEPDLLALDLLEPPDLLDAPDDFEPEFFDAAIFFLLVD